MLKPNYKISNKLLNYLSRISAAHNLIINALLVPKWEAKLRKDAMIKSAHFSTRIEGNPLTLDKVKDLFDGKDVYARQGISRRLLTIRKYWSSRIKSMA